MRARWADGGRGCRVQAVLDTARASGIAQEPMRDFKYPFVPL